MKFWVQVVHLRGGPRNVTYHEVDDERGGKVADDERGGKEAGVWCLCEQRLPWQVAGPGPLGACVEYASSSPSSSSSPLRPACSYSPFSWGDGSSQGHLNALHL